MQADDAPLLPETSPRSGAAPAGHARQGGHPGWHFGGTPASFLFLCTTNSARSQMAEALTRHLAVGEVEVESAGSQPAAEVHPLAVQAIARLGADMRRHVPKHVEALGERSFDRVIILCDAEHETCPTYHGTSKVITWNTPDPVRVEGTEEVRLRAFNLVAMELTTRIRLLLTLLEREKRAHV